ncbi:30250_t:CDS:2 [Racocetra persica]|uniref:30250_t:CDS:1 n=1 Tax=Racocetra persica TaxID=160502 RepID=A0ACA9KD95_9GLOM|nr:30250_t:CDS:2 [Racocetra persica]
MSKEGTYEKFDTIDTAKLGIHTLSEIAGLYIPIVTKDAESAMNKILNYKDDYEEFLREEKSYKAFHKFKNLLIKIKDFVVEVSKLKGVRKFLDANSVKSTYDKLTNEFETCMKDLHFKVMIVNKVQRRKDNKKVEDDLEKMNKYFEIIYERIDVNNQDIQFIKNLMTKNFGDDVQSLRIDPSELTDKCHYEHRGKIIKKYFKEACEVASWQPNPYNRIVFSNLFIKLDDLSKKYSITSGDPGLLANNTLDLDGTKENKKKRSRMPLDSDEPLIDIGKSIKIKPIIMAADNEHAKASYYLRKIYLNGECGVKKDKQSGLKYLRSVALSDNKDAIDLLNKINEKIVNYALCKKEFAENRIRELEEQHKEDLNSRDFTEFELKNQIIAVV